MLPTLHLDRSGHRPRILTKAQGALPPIPPKAAVAAFISVKPSHLDACCYLVLSQSCSRFQAGPHFSGDKTRGQSDASPETDGAGVVDIGVVSVFFVNCLPGRRRRRQIQSKHCQPGESVERVNVHEAPEQVGPRLVAVPVA